MNTTHVTAVAEQLHHLDCRSFCSTDYRWVQNHWDRDQQRATRLLEGLGAAGLTITAVDADCGLCARDVHHDCTAVAA